MVNEERMRKTFTDLVKIYAPSKGEREVCDYLKKELKKLGASRIVEDNDGSINVGNSGNLFQRKCRRPSFHCPHRPHGLRGVLPKH